MTKPAQRAFSLIKAVKANARLRLGTPPPERTLPDPKAKAGRKPRHKETLQQLIEKSTAPD